MGEVIVEVEGAVFVVPQRLCNASITFSNSFIQIAYAVGEYILRGDSDVLFPNDFGEDLLCLGDSAVVQFLP